MNQTVYAVGCPVIANENLIGVKKGDRGTLAIIGIDTIAILWRQAGERDHDKALLGRVIK